MKSLYLLPVLCVLSVEFAVCQYRWSCTAPDEDDQRYIPSERSRSTETAMTDGAILHIYRVSNLDPNCYGRVTSIEYCYRYSTSVGSGPVTFNWTVLIFEADGNTLVVNSTYTIISYGSMDGSGQDCTSSGGCCDETNIDGFYLPMDFVFGVTESAQGNTNGVTLLGFHDSAPYLVDTVQLVKAGLSLSLGSTISSGSVIQRGLRMLWFVLAGPSDRPPPSQPTSPSDSTVLPGDSPLPTSEPRATDQDTDMSTQSIMTITSSSAESAEASNISVASAVGGAVGGLIVVFVVVIVVVVIALLIIKRGHKGSMKVDDGKKVRVHSYTNALYDAANTGPNNTKIHLDVPNESVSFSNVSYEDITEQAQRELVHEYSLPSEIHNGTKLTKPSTQERAAPTPPVYAMAYETPAEHGVVAAYETAVYPTGKSTPYNEDIYMVPATNEDALYSQLSQIKINNFTRDSVKLTGLLGSGQFGKVHQGEFKVQGLKEKVNVAVKTLKEGASDEDKVKFLQEAAIMGQFSHPNVVKLYGVIKEGEPVMLILELLPNGDLRELLCRVRSESTSKGEIDPDLPHTLLSYCRQVASGMVYLSMKLFVHRDLAARNILVSEDDICKIADFGMSRDLADTNYYVSRGGMIPVKWTAPEAIHYKKYSTASDVWSFGCVMYEIWSLGHKPFEQFSNQDCIKVIDEGIRLPPPSGCPRTIYKLMTDCWHPDASGRPDFVSLVQQLSLPDTKLLKWSEEDKATDRKAATLGAELDKAVNLYNDLQECYRKTTNGY